MFLIYTFICGVAFYGMGRDAQKKEYEEEQMKTENELMKEMLGIEEF